MVALHLALDDAPRTSSRAADQPLWQRRAGTQREEGPSKACRSQRVRRSQLAGPLPKMKVDSRQRNHHSAKARATRGHPGSPLAASLPPRLRPLSAARRLCVPCCFYLADLRPLTHPRLMV